MMIETTNLTKEFGDVTAVDSIDLEVERGQIHGFVGPNGAGKTTAMQLLVGLLTPTEGTATIDGEPAGSIAAREKIGYAPQEPAFYESMTGQRYLVFMGNAAGMETARARERAAEMLSWLELEDAANQKIAGYSGGMKRRLSLGQAMIHDPELLILDEPTAALDPSGRRTIIESLQQLTDEGKTVFVSSHVLAELEQFIEHVTILVDGELVETGSLEAIRDQYGGQAFVVETSDDETVLELVADEPWVNTARIEDGAVLVVTDQPDQFKRELQERLAKHGIVLESMQQEGGLEDAFEAIIRPDKATEEAKP